HVLLSPYSSSPAGSAVSQSCRQKPRLCSMAYYSASWGGLARQRRVFLGAAQGPLPADVLLQAQPQPLHRPGVLSPHIAEVPGLRFYPGDVLLSALVPLDKTVRRPVLPQPLVGLCLLEALAHVVEIQSEACFVLAVAWLVDGLQSLR